MSETVTPTDTPKGLREVAPGLYEATRQTSIFYREPPMTKTDMPQRARTIADAVYMARRNCRCPANDGEPYVGGHVVTNCKHLREADAIILSAFSAVEQPLREEIDTLKERLVSRGRRSPRTPHGYRA